MKQSPAVSARTSIRPLLKMLVIIVAISAALLLTDRFSGRDNSTRKRFSLIQYNDSPLSELSGQGIVDGLASLGLVKGKDYDLDVANAQGDIATLNLMLDEAVNDRPEILFISSTPTLQAAVKKISALPVIFTVVADPVLAGAGSSFKDHLPNITGISTLGDYEGMIRWVKIILPHARLIGTLFSPGESNSVKNMNVLKISAEQAGLELIAVPVNSSQEVTDAAFSLASRRPDVICQIVDNLTSASAGSIIRIARDQKIPVFGFVSDQSKAGAVLVVSRDYHQAGADAARLAKRVLDGESPAKIPFEFVSKTDLLINPSAAAFFRIHFPKEIFLQKDLIITK
ncbi:MAG: ABC transporter substrate-binding protein [Bacteroidetes bacterium]|nr:ABC transporter substrate-binding protein [Bacteroidota bacterium]